MASGRACRLCLDDHQQQFPIFPLREKDDTTQTLAQKIMLLANVQVKEGDKLPNSICATCYVQIINYIKFKKCCEQSYATLLKTFKQTTTDGEAEDGNSAAIVCNNEDEQLDHSTRVCNNEDDQLDNEDEQWDHSATVCNNEDDQLDNSATVCNNEGKGLDNSTAVCNIEGEGLKISTVGVELHLATQNVSEQGHTSTLGSPLSHLMITSTSGNAQSWNDESSEKGLDDVEIDLSIVKNESFWNETGVDESNDVTDGTPNASALIVKQPLPYQPFLKHPEFNDPKSTHLFGTDKYFKDVVTHNFQRFKNKNGSTTFRCKLCRLFCQSLPKCINHVRRITRRSEKKANAIPETVERKLKCHKCGWMATTKRDITLHSVTVHRTCSTCGKYFQSSLAKDEHICGELKSNIHCQINQVSNQELTLEVPSELLGERTNGKRQSSRLTYKDKIANEEKANGDLINKNIDIKDELKKLKCQFCTVVLSSNKGLKLHTQRLHPEVVLVYFCGLCKNRAFDDKELCFIHIYNHHGGAGMENVRSEYKLAGVKQESHPKPDASDDGVGGKKKKRQVVKFQCSSCKNVYPKFEACFKHLQRSHKVFNPQKVNVIRIWDFPEETVGDRNINSDSETEPSPNLSQSKKRKTESLESNLDQPLFSGRPSIVRDNFEIKQASDGSSLYKCSKCHLGYTKYKSAYSHYKYQRCTPLTNGTAKSKLLSCIHCKLKLASHSQLIAHKKFVHKLPIKAVCKTKMTNAKATAVNLSKTSTPDGNKKYYCDVCCEHVEDLIKHTRSRSHHHRKVELDRQPPSSEDHPFPKIIFSSRNSSNNQTIKNQVSESSCNQLVFCKICQKSFKEQSILREHEATCQPTECSGRITEEVKPELQADTNVPHKCSHCGKSFASDSLLGTHVENKFCNNAYDCEICQKEFRNKGNLALHKMSHDPTQRSHLTCKICGKFYFSLGRLKKHQKNGHKKGKGKGMKLITNETNSNEIKTVFKEEEVESTLVINCSVCKESFNNFEPFEKHALDIHPEYNLLHKCVICFEVFRSSASCENHMKGNHPTSQPEPGELIFTLRATEGNRVEDKWKCDLCKATCTSYKDLRTHFTTAHSESVAPVAKEDSLFSMKSVETETKFVKPPPKYDFVVISDESSSDEDEKEDSQLKFFCKLCDQNFAMKTDLIEHLSSELHIKTRFSKLTKNKRK